MSSPGVLTAAQRTAMRAAATAICDLTCAIQRTPANTPDALGGYTQTWPTVATVPCMVGPPQGALMVAMAARIVDRRSFRVLFPVGTDVRDSDRLVIGTETLVVGSVLTPHSYDVLLAVFASEVK